MTRLVEARIAGAVGNADKRAVEVIGPCVIRTDEFPGAAGHAVDDARAAVAADVGEGAQGQVPAADDDHAFPEVLERVPVPGIGHVAFVAHHLPRGGEDALLLEREELGIAVGPRGQ